ncbi:MAG TPA: Uma2 family endonuclease [Methylomirabilota bacterium]|nr:Uma2 family endonuclease [Methylomirabilota bacterium]
MATALEPQTKRWTYEEYYRLDDDKRYEIIDGQLLLMAPGPDTWHQNWVGSLFLILTAHVRARQLGQVLLSPLDVILDSENTTQPDLIFIAKANLGIIQKRGVFGAPDLLIEIISPSSVWRDRHDKRKLYGRFGVKEYWIADPANQSLEVHILKDAAYELHCCAAERGSVTSPLLPGLQFDVADL